MNWGFLGRRLRIAFYSHDTQGLGHIRRNLLIATALANCEPRPTMLLIGGASEAGAFAMPPRTGLMVLPALGKSPDGSYYSRSLDVPLMQLVQLRANAIRAALESFEPDVLVADKVPLGALGELQPALDSLRTRGHTHCVLGLRDVLDDPVTVRSEWDTLQCDSAIRAYYEAIWVYGDPHVYDPVREYGFSREVAAKVLYTGYLDRSYGIGPTGSIYGGLHAVLDVSPGRLALCLVGGGQDGYRLADCFARAELPSGTHAVILTGPFMPRSAQRSLYRRAAHNPRLHVLGFVTKPELLIELAESIVAMGGYNTVCELLSFRKRALVVPRVTPRREQLIRTERLSALGLLDLLHPDELTPGRLSDWLGQEAGPPALAGNRVDLGGLARVRDFVEQLFAYPAMVSDSAVQPVAPARTAWTGLVPRDT